jgi:hypothetical protein
VRALGEPVAWLHIGCNQLTHITRKVVIKFGKWGLQDCCAASAAWPLGAGWSLAIFTFGVVCGKRFNKSLVFICCTEGSKEKDLPSLSCEPKYGLSAFAHSKMCPLKCSASQTDHREARVLRSLDAAPLAQSHPRVALVHRCTTGLEGMPGLCIEF